MEREADSDAIAEPLRELFSGRLQVLYKPRQLAQNAVSASETKTMHRTSTENVKHKYDDKYAEKSHSEFCVESLTLYNVAMRYKVFVMS